MSLFQYYKDKRGEWRWRLRANNNEIIASGEGYKNKKDCLHAVDLIRDLSPDAEIRVYTSQDEYFLHTRDTESIKPSRPEPEVIHAPPIKPERTSSRRQLLAIPLLLLFALLMFIFWPFGKKALDTQDTSLDNKTISGAGALTEDITGDAEPDGEEPGKAETLIGQAGHEETTHSVERGDNLWHLAQTKYHNYYLWPIIFIENKEKIHHPDVLSLGLILKIPALAGVLPHLTRSDSNKVALGYMQAYLAYLESDFENSRHFLSVAVQYDRAVLKGRESKIDASHLGYVTK